MSLPILHLLDRRCYLSLAMKTYPTPRQCLEHDRARKQRYREALHARGYVQHTLWSSPVGWAQLRELVEGVGLDLIMGKKMRTGRTGPTGRGQESADNLGEGVGSPAYPSDISAPEVQS
jgi:hypothetical protein